MRKMIVFLVLVVVASMAMAQSETTRTIHGAVIDKNGNPLPGAVVSATDGAETTLVNADGTFELEIPIWLRSVTASYAGYKNKKMKPKFDQDIIFRLKKSTNRYGFLNAYGGVNIYEESTAPTMSLMGGMLANVGFYVKIGCKLYNDNYGDEVICDVLLGGVTKSICKNIYAYIGMGYGSVLFNYDYGNTDNYYYYDTGFEYGMAFDGGVIFKIGRHFNINVGYTHMIDFYGYWNCVPNFSLGYVF